MYSEDETSDGESDEEKGVASAADADVVDPQMMANLSLDSQEENSHGPSTPRQKKPQSSPLRQEFTTTTVSNPIFNQIRTSLSLLEMLLRLTSLQQFQQQSHLSISDELLNFFLEESSSTGAGGDEQHRQHLRSEARRKVGWDPYDESPVKPRGEEYQHRFSPGHGLEGYTNERADYLSPPDSRTQNFRIRSRENTPMSPLSRASPSVRPGSRSSRSLRDNSPRVDEVPKKGTLTPRQSTPLQARKNLESDSTDKSDANS